jgi:hypothetical protein
MDQSIDTNPNEKLPDVSNCRVRRMGDGIEVCMMNAHCDYELPFGSLCAHPSASQIADWTPHLK